MTKLVMAAMWSNFSAQMPPIMPSSASMTDAVTAKKTIAGGLAKGRSTRNSITVVAAAATIMPRVTPPAM